MRCAFILTVVSAVQLVAQSDPAPLSAKRITARVNVDGRLDESTWRGATWRDGFRQRDPVEGELATQQTSVAFAFDDDAVYVAARMMVTTADAMRPQITRRDAESFSDRIIVVLDSYFDHRSAFAFGVTSAGVRLDYYHATDDIGQRDDSYDPVWQSAVAAVADGWTAEMRIPLGQLRFHSVAEQIWGVNVIRRVPALNEESQLVLVRKDEPGWVSRFAQLRGIEVTTKIRSVEVSPYAAASARRQRVRHPLNPFDDGRNVSQRLGADLRLGLSGNFTAQATINPDFGQVEADPAEVNLSVFETVFSERRPFFTEGRQFFSGGGAQYFNSRRVGAPPRVTASGHFVDQPSNGEIRAAAKLTGRTSTGLTLGVLSAVTEAASARAFDTTMRVFTSHAVQPRALVSVARAQQQFGRDNSTAGVILTAVNRDLSDDVLAASHTRSAVAAATDWTLRFRGGEYVAAFDAGVSRVDGDRRFLTALQRSSARYFQRPDADHVDLDSTRTMLSGYRARAAVNRASGQHWLWGANLSVVSPGFEINDAGQLNSADEIASSINVRYRETVPGRIFRNYSINVQNYRSWNTDGTHLGGENPSINAEGVLSNFWRLGGHYHYAPRANGATLTRGGPFMRTPVNEHFSVNLSSDPARQIQWAGSSLLYTNELGQRQLQLSGDFSYRPAGRWNVSADPSWTRSTRQRQYVATLDGGRASTFGRRYVFGEIDRREVALQLRVNYALTPDLSFELYAQPFASSGGYSRIGEMISPSEISLDEYDASEIARTTDGYRVSTEGQSFTLANPDFTVRSLRSNVVMRWEWRPGSTLFFVWQQDRSARDSFARDGVESRLADTFGLPGEQRIAVKAVYWFAR